MRPANKHAILAITFCVLVAVVIGTLEFARRRSAATMPALVGSHASASAMLNAADAVRTLKLVTWQFDTTISVDTVSDKWYGSAVANVQAPVRYQYGVDLASLRREDVLLDLADDGYVFLVPPPERIAVEVDLAKLEESLQVSGARWKSRNQDQLDSARSKLAAVAQAMTLSAEDAKRLREESRQQLETHLRNVIGGSARVSVRFAE